jgi:hypothetical protein
VGAVWLRQTAPKSTTGKNMKEDADYFSGLIIAFVLFAIFVLVVAVITMAELHRQDQIISPPETVGVEQTRN